MIEYIHNVEEETFNKMPDSIKEYVNDRRIIRCKDCKHYDHEWECCHNIRWGDGHANYPPPSPREEDFCSFGERREE